MTDDRATQFYKQAGAAAKAGDRENARALLRKALRANPRHEKAWLALASVAATEAEKLAALERLVEINPRNPQALALLAAMGYTVDAPDDDDAPSPAPTRDVPPRSAPADDAPPAYSFEDMRPAHSTDDDADEEEDTLSLRQDAPFASDWQVALPAWVTGDAPPPAPEPLAAAHDREDEAVEALGGPSDDDLLRALLGDDGLREVGGRAGDDEEDGYGARFGEDAAAPAAHTGGEDDLAAHDSLPAWALPPDDRDDDDAARHGAYDLPVFDAPADDDQERTPHTAFDPADAPSAFVPPPLPTAEELAAAAAPPPAIKALKKLSRLPDADAPAAPRSITPLRATGAYPVVPPPSASAYQEPGVPLPDAERLAAAQARAEATLRALSAHDAPADGVQWRRKARNRVGEREVLLFRALVGAGVTGVSVMALALAAAVLLQVPAVQQLLSTPTPASRFAVAIPTGTPTPLTTPTATPGFTATPSPQPSVTVTVAGRVVPSLTPTATPPSEVRRGNVNNPPTATRLAFPVPADRAVQDAEVAFGRGDYAAVLPTLSAARQAVVGGRSFDPNPYYMEAQALANLGEISQAIAVLNEAQQRRETEDPGDTAKQSLIDLGFAEVYYVQAVRAQRAGRTSEASSALSNLEQRTRALLDAGRYRPQASLLLARRFRAAGRPNDAVAVLEEALERTPADVALVAELGEVFFAQGRLPQAGYQAWLTLYADPRNPQGHSLTTRVVLAQAADPGQAVRSAQAYLFYHPVLVEGWQLLAEARAQEGNDALELFALQQMVQVADATDQPFAPEALVRIGDLEAAQGRWEQAEAAYARAFALRGDPADRLAQARLALRRAAPDDTLRLVRDIPAGAPAGARAQADLLRAQALLLRDPASASTAREAASLLTGAVGNLPTDLRPAADTARAQAALGAGQPQEALNAAGAAIGGGGDTPARRLLRAQAHEALGNFPEALADYAWAQTFGLLAASDAATLGAADDGVARVQRAIEQAASATATARAPTATPTATRAADD